MEIAGTASRDEEGAGGNQPPSDYPTDKGWKKYNVRRHGLTTSQKGTYCYSAFCGTQAGFVSESSTVRSKSGMLE